MSRASGLGAAAPLFAALGDPTRLKLVSRLCAEGPLSTVHLGAGSGMTRQALDKHLAALAHAGLVEGTRGRPRVWQLKPRRLDDARAWLDRISRQWDLALGRLKSFVEED
ncbi:MAG TPA: metalloregulator ArsR/SmtB family transcription factor [Polyangia bacterium]|nr:metalloregulator ArsR/SmtB family transcription factor [Polyangia bacterium]